MDTTRGQFPHKDNNTATRDTIIQVTMMSHAGRMYSMRLPDRLEGRYRFADTLSNASEEVLSFYAEPCNGRWLLYCGCDGQFFSNGVPCGTNVELGDKIYYKVCFGNEEYAIYSECGTHNSNAMIPYYVSKNSAIRIGRRPDCDICYPNNLVSREHAILYRHNSDWEIEDTNSVNGVYVNGHIVKRKTVTLGDVIYILGLKIAIGAGYIGINIADNRATITSPLLHPIEHDTDVFFSRAPVHSNTLAQYKRKPAKRRLPDSKPIKIEMPPMSLSGNKIPLLLRMGSPAVMGSRAALSGNIALTLTSLVFPLLTNGYSEKERKEYEAKRILQYTQYLSEKENEIQQAIIAQETQLRNNLPSVNTLLGEYLKKERLWERRVNDEEFLRLRIGYGRLPFLSEIDCAPEKLNLERDELEEKMYALAKHKYTLNDVPISFSPKDYFISSVEGELNTRITMMQSLIFQAAIYHSYENVKIGILSDENNINNFEFARFLPHCWSKNREMRFIGCTKSDAYTIAEHIKKELEPDLDKPRELRTILKEHPFYLFFVLDKGLYESVELFKELSLLDSNIGISLITAFDSSPFESNFTIELFGNGHGITRDFISADSDDHIFSTDDLDISLAEKTMRKISGIVSQETDESFSLPKTYTFLEMFNVGRIEHLNPLSRWANNSPIKSLAAPVGIGIDGDLFYLDLHEKHHGPHGLVAGMTGSGKSEFIITYILSMAVNYSPDEVAFILIDYKGGGLASSFEDTKRGIHLPHVVGTITNLDGASIQRSLMSINSELKRRQAVFNEAKTLLNEGTMDIYTYQQYYRSKKVSEPMPHLFIISDEFAELKQQQPDFMNELISTARIGRSLGVHLILATQKPSGVVNDQIWSNSKFRVCLKVQGKQDSMDMLKRTEAAELKDTGRFYLQVGYNEYFAMGQSAWCGAEYLPQDHVVVEPDYSVHFLDLTGQAILKTKPKTIRQKSGKKQLVAIVQYLSELAEREKISAKKLWTEPLADCYDLLELKASVPAYPGNSVSALLGMIDAPEQQRQFPYVLDIQSCRNLMVIGSGGSGKSTLLRTILYDLAELYSPEHINFYLLDFSGGLLSVYKDLPHCGAYLDSENEDSIVRFWKMYMEMVAERKKLFADAGVSNFESYTLTHKLPLCLVFIDNFAGMSSLKCGNQLFSSFQDYLKASSGCGIKVIVSCSNFNEISLRAKQEIGNYVALHMKDKYAYSDVLGHRCSFVPAALPGRGMCVYENNYFEFHTAMPYADRHEQEQTVLISRRVAELSEKYSQYSAARKLPVIKVGESFESFCADIPLGRIPLGYELETVKKINIPLSQLYSASVYFGNPRGVSPVLTNFIYAAKREKMEILVVKRSVDSVFDSLPCMNYAEGISFMDCTQNESLALCKRLLSEIPKRKVYRNAYCTQNNIPPEKAKSPTIMRKAAPFIRANTMPLMVIFEDFYEFSQNLHDECFGPMREIFAGGKGYNFYFISCYYPETAAKMATDLLNKSYNPDGFMLFFGGRYDAQTLTNMPHEYKRISSPLENYDQFIMKYGSKFYPMKMPCGDITAVVGDADDAPII